MSIKSKAILFRNFLYLNDVVKVLQINKSAENNGIKSSNLSKIIKDLEDITGKKLFIRTNKGLIPTQDAIALSDNISKLESSFNQLTEQILKKESNETLSLYLPDNIEIKNTPAFNFSAFLICKDINKADVIVSYSKPDNCDNLIVTENYIGDNLKQKIWVCSINSPSALNLAQSIIRLLHLG